MPKRRFASTLKPEAANMQAIRATIEVNFMIKMLFLFV
jgi:hypothetical protein